MRFVPDCDLSPLAHVRIEAVVRFRHVTRRPKLIGRNAKRDVHGDLATETVVRLYASDGLSGIGFGNVSDAQADAIVGCTVASLWAGAPGTPSLGRADHALFDLTGKALGLPAWALIGGHGPEWVPVYDTSLYFSDLLPEHAHRGIARLIDELDAGLARGHRAFKVKVGRGARWMDAEDGLARDMAVVRALARHAGSGIALMADANDQYGAETARRFIGEVGDRLAFVEEMFPEAPAACRSLRDWIAAQGLATRVADGESEHDPHVHAMLARAGALDILQPDIRALGLRLQCALADAVADLPGVAIASHNWGSYLGTFKMLQLGRGIGNFMTAELDASASNLFDDSAWPLRDGAIRVPDAPGCGLSTDETVFRERYLPGAQVSGSAARCGARALDAA